MTTTRSSSSGWRVYALLAALRVAASLLLLSIIHPDEFFQSQEVMARHVLQRDAALRSQLHLPWEYHLPSPNRSVLFPSLVAGLPYRLLQALGVPMSGPVLLIVPRLLLCLVSFSIDMALYRCARVLGVVDPMHVVLSFASSWTTLVFLTRPFSNTFETLVLALCMATLLCFNPYRRVLGGVLHVQTLLLGSLLAIGFFTRFTFPFFFLPLGLELVRRQDELLGQAQTKKTTGTTPSTLSRLIHAIGIAMQGLLAFVLFSAAITLIDTWYFHDGVVSFKAVVVAPWNNLQYNLQADNLALHGVHPRITHALVNMPMLFGPLFLVFLVKILRQPRQVVWQAACVAIPLALISLAPHQEPRFLLPLLVPLHLFAGATVAQSKWLRVAWIVFNVALAIFFGVLHQGGVLPFLLTMSESSAVLSRACTFQDPGFTVNHNTPLVFFKTYMPPRFALANANRAWGSAFQVVDLAGGREMHAQLAAITAKEVILAAPASVDVGPVAASWTARVEIIGSCTPHVSTEDLEWGKPFALMIYRLVRS